jgi:hypothetical protein
MPLSDAELSAHDPLARAFLRHLRAALLPGAFEERPADHSEQPDVLVARVFAAAPAVGDVLIYSDSTELTAFVGDHTHEHTGIYLFGEPTDPAALEQVAAAEAAWIRDLLEDRVVVWSRRTEGRQVLAGGTWNLGNDATARPGVWRRYATEAWFWSGRPFPLK